MKRITGHIFLYALCAVLSSSCSDGGTYKIKGEIKGFTGDVDMNLLDVGGRVINSCVMKEGVFEMEGSAKRPMLTYLNNGFDGEYPLDIPLLLENKKIKVRGDVSDFSMKITGTAANENMTAFKAAKDKLAPDDDEGYLKLVKETFEENTDNLLGALLILNLADFVSDGELLEYCDRVPQYFFEDRTVSHPRDMARSRVNTAPGKHFTDIEVTAEDSTCVRLSDIAGKGQAVMLVFWSSWARNIDDYFASLMPLCDRYRSRGLTMFTVAFDHQRDRCDEYTVKYGLFGHNFRPDSNMARKLSDVYGIGDLPYSVLIAPDGTIAARGEISGMAEALDKIYPASVPAE